MGSVPTYPAPTTQIFRTDGFKSTGPKNGLEAGVVRLDAESLQLSSVSSGEDEADIFFFFLFFYFFEDWVLEIRYLSVILVMGD